MFTLNYPALSEDGWVRDPLAVADYLFSDFLLSDYSQSETTQGKIASLPYIIQNYQENLDMMKMAINTTLTAYYGRYFTDIVVEVEDVPNLVNPAKLQLSIYLSFVDENGMRHTLAKAMDIMESKIMKVTTINNG